MHCCGPGCVPKGTGTFCVPRGTRTHFVPKGTCTLCVPRGTRTCNVPRGTCFWHALLYMRRRGRWNDDVAIKFKLENKKSKNAMRIGLDLEMEARFEDSTSKYVLLKHSDGSFLFSFEKSGFALVLPASRYLRPQGIFQVPGRRRMNIPLVQK